MKLTMWKKCVKSRLRSPSAPPKLPSVLKTSQSWKCWTRITKISHQTEERFFPGGFDVTQKDDAELWKSSGRHIDHFKMFGRKGQICWRLFLCQEQDYKMKMERGYKIRVEIEDQKTKQKPTGVDGWQKSTAIIQIKFQSSWLLVLQSWIWNGSIIGQENSLNHSNEWYSVFLATVDQRAGFASWCSPWISSLY